MGEDKHLVRGDLLGEFFQVGGGGNKQIFSWWEGPPPILPSTKTNIYTIVPACVLAPLANHNPSFFSVPRGTEKLGQAKRPDNSNVLPMFNNNTHIDFRTAYIKHLLIRSYFIQVL